MNFSYHVKSTMNSLLGFSALLSTVEDAAVARDYGRIIEEKASYLNRLVGNYLELVKLSGLKYHGADASWRPAMELVREVAIAREVELLISGRRNSLHLRAPEDFPAHIRVPPVFALALEHLIDNALRFTREGGRIEVCLAHFPTEWTIAVADTGIGMSVEQLNSAFRPFRRLDIEDFECAGLQGAGLGLPLVRAMAAALGGAVHIDTHPGRGTTVRMAFSLDRVTDTQLPT